MASHRQAVIVAAVLAASSVLAQPVFAGQCAIDLESLPPGEIGKPIGVVTSTDGQPLQVLRGGKVYEAAPGTIIHENDVIETRYGEASVQMGAGDVLQFDRNSSAHLTRYTLPEDPTSTEKATADIAVAKGNVRFDVVGPDNPSWNWRNHLGYDKGVVESGGDPLVSAKPDAPDDLPVVDRWKNSESMNLPGSGISEEENSRRAAHYRLITTTYAIGIRGTRGVISSDMRNHGALYLEEGVVDVCGIDADGKELAPKTLEAGGYAVQWGTRGLKLEGAPPQKYLAGLPKSMRGDVPRSDAPPTVAEPRYVRDMRETDLQSYRALGHLDRGLSAEPADSGPKTVCTEYALPSEVIAGKHWCKSWGAEE